MAKPEVGAQTCDNCGRAIGRLETPYSHGEHVVCSECHLRLTSQSAAASSSTSGHQPGPSLLPAVQTVEATAKIWKACQVLGAVGFVPGGIMFAIGYRNDSRGLMVGGAVLFALGFLTYAVGAGCAWWFHG
jgi:hypothetical protein